jgi:hypothetical protein
MEATMTSDDYWFAMRLPDDFAARPGNAFSRLWKVVTENWSDYEGLELTRLMELLFPVLEPLTETDAVISDELRGRCVDLVDRWLIETQSTLV